MEIYTQMLAVLDIMMTLFTGVLGDASGTFMGADGSFFDFAVQVSGGGTVCTQKSCPGSFYTAITTAWANIGYLTHADVLRFLNTTHFGKWAVLLYIAAAITGLLGVATNSPMRNYTWFFIGPALFSFLVGTTMPVQGVNWVVANRAASAEGMAEVWRNAEAGLANTRLALDGLIKINGKNGPDREYDVAMPMVFLDELFSATSNILIEWTGIGRQVDNGGAESNLSGQKATRTGRQATEAWWLLSNMKWGYIENITGSTMRNPDLRDALITFLASECGDLFKQGIDSGSYIAATQARGATVVDTVMADNSRFDYVKFNNLLGNVFIPTPRSLARLYKEKRNDSFVPGSVINFSESLNKAVETGRTKSVVCSEYLWTIIQGLRFEAGNSYYQMLRSAPNGFDEAGFVTTLLYGWDARETENKDIEIDDQKAFLKHLIMAYILRNELISAPQLTTVDQRYAPAEQAKSYSEANIRNFGAKAKFIELYNAAVMMPYLQGILAYFLIVSYPIACMLVILPGHYKGFFTWVSFFAWIKLWDVGFAMVHVVERSVWAMIGNHSHMAATARTLIATAKKVGGVGADPQYGADFVGPVQTSMEAANAVPIVCSLAAGTVDGRCTDSAGKDQIYAHAYELFDKLLLTGANLDLDLSNGWYIYIMAALYTAVPAVTGQLVLGAKAGSASLVKDAFQGAANDGGQAAKTGAQHAAVNALQTNQKSLGQMAMAKALRKGTGPNGEGPSLATQGVMAGNQSLRESLQGARAGLNAGDLESKAGIAGKSLTSFDRAAGLVKAAGLGGGAGASNFGTESAKVAYGRRADTMGVASAAQGRMAAYEKDGRSLAGKGYETQGQLLGAQADFEAQSAAWEAKNDFAAHASAMGGIAGMNAGNLAPQEKPQDARGMGVYGMLDGYAGKDVVRSGQNHSGELLWGGTGLASEASGFFSTPEVGAGGNPTFVMDANGAIRGGGGAGAVQSQQIYGTWNEGRGSHTGATALETMVAEGTNLKANTGYDKADGWFNSVKSYAADSLDLKIDNAPGPVNRVDSSGTMQGTAPFQAPELPAFVPGSKPVNETLQGGADILNGKK